MMNMQNIVVDFKTLQQFVETLKREAIRIHARDDKVRAVLVAERLNFILEILLMCLQTVVKNAEKSSSNPDEDYTQLLKDVTEIRGIWSCSIDELITFIDPQDDEMG